MRENVAPLVSAAHIDCPGLTVHDVTHLDALWETASMIGGDNFALNPAEAFVLGGAILLHDAGMAVASYEGGIAEIRKTAVWLDAIATADGFDDEETIFNEKMMFREKDRRFRGQKRFHDERYSEAAKRQADFAALRYYHAQQAENLAARAFQSANSSDPIFLIEDRGLRDAYGQTIGKIAHSHHWDVDGLATALRSQIGAIAGFPTEWSVNAIKVATILRCADAAHIDATRAPTMLFSLLAPSGLSKDHWNFQNRLLKATPRDGKIVLTSSRAFAEDDAEAWWLCYETVQLIDREIRQCNSLLASGNDGTFAAQGIAGVESPKLFSNYVECDGWIPVNIDVKVSDAKGLASTLGGRNLYGDGYASPLKELIQNAADAIRARRALEERDAGWGKISITLESKARENVENQSDIWLHIDDNGIGMSEAVLTGPLIDLGNSFWKSNLLSFEYPGLQAKKPRTIGKFGIGFFSVFILGNEVKVASRPFGAAETDGKVVHFKSLERKPVFRTARSGEIPRDAVTRVSVKLHNHMHQRMENEQIQRGGEQAQKWNFSDEVMWQCATLDVNVTVAAANERRSSHHRWDWWAAPKAIIAESVFGRAGVPTSKCRELGNYCDFLHCDGKVVGFGVVRPIANRYGATEGFVGVQGISYLDDSHNSGSGLFVGIQDGVTHDASRKKGFPNIERESLANWASQQA
jgi:Histidine kinase-, DNA gyrase B-, and HSP90-like ATPase